MKIGILELHYHEEYLETLLKLFDADEITVYTTKRIHENLDKKIRTQASKYVFKEDSQSKKDFINSIETKDFDYFFVNTIQPSMVDVPSYVNFSLKCTSILTLHNLEAWKSKSIHVRPNLLHTLDSFAASLFLDKILNNYDYIAVPNKYLTQTAENYFDKPVLFIPFALCNEELQTSKENLFVIPGTVDERRRDYITVFDAFKIICEDYPDVKLMLLGRSNKDEVKKIFLGSSPTEKDKDILRNNIITYDTYVKKEIYNTFLEKACCIICPSVPTTHTINTATETYGVTKSPNIHESIKFGKPLVLPHYIVTQTPTTLHYATSCNLFSCLQHYLQHPEKMVELQNVAQTFSKNFYTKEKVYKSLMDCLNIEAESRVGDDHDGK